MEDLLPRDEYDINETGVWDRVGWFAGLGFGLPMAVFFFLSTDVDSVALRLVIAGGAGLVAGIAFGVLFPWGMRRNTAAMVGRMYARDLKLVGTPPAGTDLRYALPCSWVRTSRFTVGGILYLGPGGLLFVPHKANLPRDRAGFDLAPNERLEMSLVPQKPPRLAQWMIPRPQPFLRVTSPGGTYHLLVPSPVRVLQLIEQRLGELKRESANA